VSENVMDKLVKYQQIAVRTMRDSYET